MALPVPSDLSFLNNKKETIPYQPKKQLILFKKIEQIIAIISFVQGSLSVLINKQIID